MTFDQTQIILNFTHVDAEILDELVQAAINYGFTSYFVSKLVSSRFQTYSSFKIYEIFEDNSPGDSNFLIYPLQRPYLDNLKSLEVNSNFKERKWGVQLDIESKEDLLFLSENLIKYNPPVVICKPIDWTIIPLENLLADVQNKEIALIADIGHDLEQIPSLFSVLERGVDGVLWQPKTVDELLRVKNMILCTDKVTLLDAKVVNITDIPHAERVCVDSSSLLSVGEGMWVGNTAQGFGFVHGEVFESEFVASRPFRVNAGDVSEYILVPKTRNDDVKNSTSGFQTRYLSELRAGDQVFVVNLQGELRVVSVGRVKIETRPMRMLKMLPVDPSLKSSIIITVQYAETVRLVKNSGEIVSITDIKCGDLLKVVLGPGATHFGQKISENIVEK